MKCQTMLTYDFSNYSQLFIEIDGIIIVSR